MTVDALGELEDHLAEQLGDLVDDTRLDKSGDLIITVPIDSIVDVLRLLREDAKYQFIALTDIIGVDYPVREKRFDVCYQLLSPSKNFRMRVKVMTDEIVPVPSVCSIYAGAEWYEREIYDMYGVRFSDHPDMRRILTDYGFDGYPLRKDFPVTGFVECRYDDKLKRIVYEPVLLRQEIRNFDFLSPWEDFDHARLD
ncbi:MAG: NADH-quinone oxidoreductase subunit C [Candidatus Tokpelaia sp. JSC085]|nr:MAG: NADH-quinone oxidoreductase subunit C [Candidatus Tokpelaia sp. JSC085]